MMNAIHMRGARAEDVPTIVHLFSTPDLDIGKHEEPSTPLLSAYYEAFERIERDPNNRSDRGRRERNRRAGRAQPRGW